MLPLLLCFFIIYICGEFFCFFPGKAHIRYAILGQEEALRIYSLCEHLNKLETLKDILKASHHLSLEKYSDYEDEEEFTNYMEAPDVIRESCVFKISYTTLSLTQDVEVWRIVSFIWGLVVGEEWSI